VKLKNWLKRFFNSLDTETGKQLVVIEIGCGVSLHSLRWESELLWKEAKDNVKIIRVNPTDFKGSHFYSPFFSLKPTLS